LTVASLSSPSFHPQALNEWGIALYRMAYTHSIQGRNERARNERAFEMYELAVPKFEAALELDPRDSVTLQGLGSVRAMQSELMRRCGEVRKAGPCFKQAADCFRRGLKESPDDEALKQSLKVLMEQGPPR
jgi:tetratricopeptide (TPR) repeat protein